MRSLSTPIGALRSRYDVVVVGSGYGGAIAAYRMAEKSWTLRQAHQRDFSVGLLERGVERQPGDYPSTLTSVVPQVQGDTAMGHVGSRTGLFDVRINPDVSVLVGCGLGGTSLINAGVMLQPDPHIFAAETWPADLRQPGALDDDFKTVSHGLGVNPCPPHLTLKKVQWLNTAAERAHTTATSVPVAISFATQVNGFDVQQQSCVLCGNCVTGCNHSAKNTVATNFLPGAANLGAAIFCGVSVRAVESTGDGEWLIHAHMTDSPLQAFGTADIAIRAQVVFLSAGTLGPRKFCCRSRKQYGLSLSGRLGATFSGNGDVLAFWLQRSRRG